VRSGELDKLTISDRHNGPVWVQNRRRSFAWLVSRGDQNTDTLQMNTDPGLQSGPVVADQVSMRCSVGWIDGSTVKLGFFTELGQPDPLQPTVVLTDGFYGSTTSPASVSDLQLSRAALALAWEWCGKKVQLVSQPFCVCAMSLT